MVGFKFKFIRKILIKQLFLKEIRNIMIFNIKFYLPKCLLVEKKFILIKGLINLQNIIIFVKDIFYLLIL
jgi:hypothetical protein